MKPFAVSLFLAAILLSGCGGSAPSAPVLGSAGGLSATVVLEVGNKNTATFAWTSGVGQGQTLEIGRSSGASDVAAIELGPAVTTHTQTALPIGVLYARVVATAGGTRAAPSNEVLVGSYDPRQIIDAALLGSGPLAVGDNQGCARFGSVMDGFPLGTKLTIQGTTTLSVEQMTALRDTAAQVAALTAGNDSAEVVLVADPGSRDSNPGQDRMLIRAATQAEVLEQCRCTNCVGCASSYFRGSTKTGMFIQVLSTNGAPTVAHEIGHGVGFCHIINAAGINPPMTMGVTTDGLFSPNGRLSKIDPVLATAMATAYKAGLKPGDPRPRFLSAGLVPPDGGSGLSAMGLDAAGVVSDPWRPLRSKSRDELAKIAEKMLGKGAHIEFTDGTDEVRVTKLFCQIETPTMR